MQGISLSWDEKASTQEEGEEAEMEDRSHPDQYISKYVINKGSQAFHYGRKESQYRRGEN